VASFRTCVPDVTQRPWWAAYARQTVRSLNSKSGSREDGGRWKLQVTLLGLSAIPCWYGMASMLTGARAVPGNRIEVDASFDSEYRFVNTFWFAAAPAIWSSLPKVEERPVALQAVMATAFVGGLARLMSWRTTGRPRPVFVAGIGLELVGMPVLWLWQGRVSRAAAVSDQS
jgi:hypothetical protein